MASTIAAITTGGGGVITTADSSGDLSLLSGATTVVAVTSAGASVTGTLVVSGGVTLTTALTVAQGGTGATTLTNNSLVVGAGTSAVTGIAAGTSGNVLTSNGTTWASTAAAGVPAGSIVGFGSVTPPTGWLACNGANVSRTTYATLFAVISTTFGVGDGTTTFTLPTSARRTLVGSGGSATGTLSNTVGSSGGEETHVQSGSELAGHIHSITTIVTAATGGTRLVRGTAGTQVGLAVDSSGSSSAANIMQPSLVINYIIKT